METATARRRRRVNWFRHGVHAIACAVSPKPPEAYVCPLCLDFFTSEQLDAGVLTDEHVPPKSVGGKELVLTCVSCNKASGNRLDEALADEEKLRTFGEPHALGSFPGSASIDGLRNNGSIRFDGRVFEVVSHPGQNNLETLAAYSEAQDRLVSGSSIELAFRIKGSPKRASLGWIRAAYLAAFAVYGYRYVLQPAFGALRAAIADPDHTGFDPVILQVPHEGALNPFIVEVAGPASFAGCRAAVFGPRLVLLPHWGAPEDWYAKLRDQVTREPARELALVSVIGRRFPEYPMYLTDG